MSELTSSQSTVPTTDWVEKLYQAKLKAGFEPRLTAVIPERPTHRINEVWGDIYEYETVLGDYRSPEDKRLAELFCRRISELIRTHGVVNVAEIPLPREFSAHAHPDYPHRVQRLILARPVAQD